jgi:hypothetical protein
MGNWIASFDGIRLRRVALGVAFCYALSVAPTYAYLDPGSGALLIQGLIAGVAGGLIAFRQVLGRMLLYLKKGREPQPEPPKAVTSEDNAAE